MFFSNLSIFCHIYKTQHFHPRKLRLDKCLLLFCLTLEERLVFVLSALINETAPFYQPVSRKYNTFSTFNVRLIKIHDLKSRINPSAYGKAHKLLIKIQNRNGLIQLYFYGAKEITGKKRLKDCLSGWKCDSWRHSSSFKCFYWWHTV